MEMNKKTIEAFRDDFSKAVLGLERKYGVKVNLTNIRFCEANFSSKIIVENIMATDAEENRKKLFEAICEQYGFKKKDYARIVIIKNKNFEFVGFNPRASKNICEIRELNSGTIYATSLNTVKTCMI